MRWTLVPLGLAIVDGITGYLIDWFFEFCGRLWVDGLRVKAMLNILTQPREWLDNPANSPAELSQILDRSAEEVRNLLGRFVPDFFTAASMIIISVALAMIGCWKLTYIDLATIPAIYGLTRMIDLVYNRWEKKTYVQMRIIGNTLTGTFMNIRIVRALTPEDTLKRNIPRRWSRGIGLGRREDYILLCFMDCRMLRACFRDHCSSTMRCVDWHWSLRHWRCDGRDDALDLWHGLSNCSVGFHASDRRFESYSDTSPGSGQPTTESRESLCSHPKKSNSGFSSI